MGIQGCGRRPARLRNRAAGALTDTDGNVKVTDRLAHRRLCSYKFLTEFRGHSVHVTWVLPAQLVLTVGVTDEVETVSSG